MSQGLESVIRPFQDRSVAPAVLILDDKIVEAPKLMSFGSEGGATFSFSYSFSGQAKSAGPEDWKETKRKSETVRITNPDDESQFVDTKRAKEVEFNDTQTGLSKFKFRFNYPDSTTQG